MAKLTEKQANILRQALSGSIIMHRIGMYSDSWHFEGGEHIDGRSALGLHTRGLIRPHIDRDPSGIDYPYMISDAGREAIAAYDAKHAAIAANVSADAATDAWIIENAGADGAELSEPAPDAAQTAAAVTVASIQAKLDAIEWTDAGSGRVIIATVEQLTDGIGCEWFFKDTGLWLDFEKLGNTLEDAMHKVVTMINTDDRKVDPKDTQIAALKRELAAAKAEADAMHDALEEIDQLASYPDESGCEPGDVWCLVQEIRQIAFNATLTDPDAALASARQRADDGTRHSVADVEAALEAQWAEAWTPKVGDRVRIKADARFDHMNAAAREQIESIRDAHIVGRVIDRALGLVKVDFEGICPNMVAEKLEPEAQS